MKLSVLLDRLRIEKDLAVDERTDSDGVQQFIVSTTIPFPQNRYEWYVFTLPDNLTAEQFEVEQWQIDAMLRHLWMFQLQIGEEQEEAMEDEVVPVKPPKTN